MVCLLLWAFTVPILVHEQAMSAKTSPSTVVQRFVDAANRRDLDGMMATVAPDAVFSVLPSGEILGSGREAIREYYGRLIASVKPGLVVRIASRIEDTSFVVDHEEFYEDGTRSSVGPIIWVYWVRDGLIRQAWRLRELPK